MDKRSRFARALGPLLFPVVLALVVFAVFSLSRAGLVAYYWRRVHDTADWWRVFTLGLRLDTVTVCSIVALPLLIGLSGLARNRVAIVGMRVYATVIVAVVVWLEVSTPSFVNEYDSRPNRLFVSNLVPSPELRNTLWSDYRYALMAVFALTALALWSGWRLSGHVLRRQLGWPWWAHVGAVPISAATLVLGIRGLDHRPINISSVFFSSQHLVNELALNTTYSVGYSIYLQRHESNPADLYGKMPLAETVARVRKYLGAPPDAYTNPEVPFQRRVTSRARRERPCNVVVVLEESLGAPFVGCLGGLPLTPSLDALAKEGLLFRRLYSTGTRTVRGMEATISGFLPTPGESAVKLERSQVGFFTVASLLRRHGYLTEFVYGGESHFDNMRAFLLGNGFERVLDQRDYENPVFHGTWGVSDEDLMREANRSFVSHGDRPFFALILSTSNHSPFEFPAGRIELYDQPQATRHNSVKYADFAIGELFRLAKKERYFANTIFVVVADHNLRTFGDDLIPVPNFRIPALIIGPGIAAGTTYDEVASQVDLLPTILPLVGIEGLEHPMLGRDVLSLPAGTPGRAIMQQFGSNALMIGDRVVVRQPHLPPLQFTLTDGRLVPCDSPDAELTRDSLAHALVPWVLYSEKRHRLE